MKKKALFTAVLMVLMCAYSTLSAQTDSTNTATQGRQENVATPKKHSKNNIQGLPIYYDRYGQPRGSAAPSDMTYHMPRRHYLADTYYHYCHYFLEADALIGRQSFAPGMRLSYVADRWGGYGSVHATDRKLFGSAGPVLRLTGEDAMLDFQIYAGALVSNKLGYEVGFRLADAPHRENAFCWMSTSMGVASMGGKMFLTFGLSLEMKALTVLALIG